jgi:hypothetical protein
MTPWWKMGLGAFAAAFCFGSGWQARVVWDEAQAAKVQREQIEEHAKAEKAANGAASDYEKQKQAMESQIYVLKQNLSKARRASPGACRVPPDVVQSVRSAASGDLPR